MRAFVVIGANYGDEGKGLMTDYLCDKYSIQVVVRHNGGAQAGHTVITPQGHRHVFGHIGSGHFAGARTHLSRFFICNPILYCKELLRLGDNLPTVSAEPTCLVTTPYDMLLNQALERKRGNERHGSCGVGINETIVRSESDPKYRLQLSDVCGDLVQLNNKLWTLNEYFVARLRELDLSYPAMNLSDLHIEFIDACDIMRRNVALCSIKAYQGYRTLFEGAQGLLLDQNNHKDFPHVTRSNTGIENAGVLAGEIGISRLDAVYVTRTYLTRHGAGPLADEWDIRPPTIRDETNIPHQFQGSLRFAELDVQGLGQRIFEDCAKSPISPTVSVALTCMDQWRPKVLPHYNYVSRGPTREHVHETT